MEPVLVVDAADRVEVGFAAGGAGDAPVGEIGGGAEEAGLDDAARVEDAGGQVVAGIVVDDEEGVAGAGAGVERVVGEGQSFVGLADAGVAEIGAKEVAVEIGRPAAD